VSSDGESFSYLMVHVGADWMVRTSAYEDKTPILTVDAGRGAIAITIKDRGAVDKSAVEFARALARNAQAFAAEVERLSAGETEVGNDGNGKAADVTAA
jgi:hypothetical protein